MSDLAYTYNDTVGTATPGWWEKPDNPDLPDDLLEKMRANSLYSICRNLENVQREVHEQNLWSAQLYSNRELAAFDWGNAALYRASLAPINRTGENLMLEVVDTLVSQIGKQKPKPKPQTRGASWKLRKQARLLDKFLYGEFMRNRVWEQGKRVFRDACIFGFGALYVCMDGDKLYVERVFPDEILVDQMEVVACGRMKHIYRRRVLPAEVVAAHYGVDVAEIESIARTTDYLEYRTVGKGWVVVVEGYQMAMGDKPGRWMVAVQNKILDEGEYTEELPPFVIYHWQSPLSGFYYPGAVEQALPYQIRLNEINEVIRDAQDLMGRPRILVAEGSRVSPHEVDNAVARFIKYTGIKPEAVTWPAINAEIYNERDRIYRICMEHFGLSQLASKVTPPAQARFDSSPAFREFNAIQDDRLADPAQRLERFYLDVAETMVRTIRNSGTKPTTMWYSGGKKARCEIIDWSEIDLDENEYVLQLEATSVYDSTPSAIRDDLEKQLAMGLITPEEYRLELASPDDTSELSLQAAAAADIRRVVELLEEGDYEEPTPIQDLVNGVQVVSLAALNLNQYEGVPASVKLNFINWITAARGLLESAAEKQEEPAGQPQAPMVGAGAPPMPGAPPGMGGFPGAPGPSAVPVPENMGLATQPLTPPGN